MLKVAPILSIKDTFFKDTELNKLYSRYDALAIALKMIEIIIDEMGPRTGISKNELFTRTVSLLKMMDCSNDNPQNNEENYKIILEKVFENLIHQTKSEGIRIDYADYSSNPPIKRTLVFRLITYRNYDNESIVLHAESEAINFFVQMLDIDLEDQQKASYYVLERQINRGDFDNALESARRNLLLTTQYQLKIEETIKNTHRDIKNLDWDSLIPKELDFATQHIQECLESQMKQEIKVNSQLESLGIKDFSKRKVLIELKNALDKSRKKLIPLQSRINQAREAFLEEQIIQEFLKPVTNKINIEKDLLESFLDMEYGFLLDHLTTITPFFTEIEIQKFFNYDQILKLCIKDIDFYESNTNQEKIIHEEFQEQSLKLNNYDLEIKEEAIAFILQSINESPSGVYLSDIIINAISRNKGFLVCNYLRLLIQGLYANQKFEYEFANQLNLDIFVLDKIMDNQYFYGNNFLIKKREGMI